MNSLDQSRSDRKAEQAFSAYQAIVSQLRTNATLLDNEEWNALRIAAYDQFLAAFEALQ